MLTLLISCRESHCIRSLESTKRRTLYCKLICASFRYTFFLSVRFSHTTMKISEHNLAVWQGCNKQFVLSLTSGDYSRSAAPLLRSAGGTRLGSWLGHDYLVWSRLTAWFYAFLSSNWRNNTSLWVMITLFLCVANLSSYHSIQYALTYTCNTLHNTVRSGPVGYTALPYKTEVSGFDSWWCVI